MMRLEIPMDPQTAVLDDRSTRRINTALNRKRPILGLKGKILGSIMSEGYDAGIQASVMFTDDKDVSAIKDSLTVNMSEKIEPAFSEGFITGHFVERLSQDNLLIEKLKEG